MLVRSGILDHNKNMQQAHWTHYLYILNFSLLVVHEIDSAFWQEWILFGIPGGIQVFAILHIPLIILGMMGYRDLLLNKRSGAIYSMVIAGAGIFAFCIHTAFILAGRPEFTLPFSQFLLGVILVTSSAQIILTWPMLRSPGAPLVISKS